MSRKVEFPKYKYPDLYRHESFSYVSFLYLIGFLELPKEGYIGTTDGPGDSRPLSHFVQAIEIDGSGKYCHNNKKSRWIRDGLDRGLTPFWVPIVVMRDPALGDLEVDAIRRYRAAGWKLYNTGRGGEGRKRQQPARPKPDPDRVKGPPHGIKGQQLPIEELRNLLNQEQAARRYEQGESFQEVWDDIRSRQADPTSMPSSRRDRKQFYAATDEQILYEPLDEYRRRLHQEENRIGSILLNRWGREGLAIEHKRQTTLALTQRSYIHNWWYFELWPAWGREAGIPRVPQTACGLQIHELEQNLLGGKYG